MAKKSNKQKSAAKAKAHKKIVKVPKEISPDAKLRKKPQYKSFRLHKRIKHPSPPLPSWWALFRSSLALLSANRRPIMFFALIYGALSLLLVRGLSSPVNIDEIKDTLSNVVGEDSVGVLAGFTAFGVLINASTQATGEVAQLYQSFFLVVASLAIIWLYRQQQAGNLVTIRMAFYRGMYPLIPFILLLLLMAVQLVPVLVGNFLFSTVIGGGLAVGLAEQVLWLLFFVSTIMLSGYFIISSSIALYIVTLPEMTPILALREARELVRYRRASILFKIIALVLIIFAIFFVIVLPIIFVAPTLAEWIFFFITVLTIPLIHGYMFSLYRELL